jgi:hypothetical protein
MDFVEKVLHVSPGGGDGAYEVLIVVLVGSLIFAGARSSGIFEFVSREKVEIPTNRPP